MAIPKKLSKEQIEINKNKQRLLNSAGYNVKVDGSWGPWQEQQYNKIMSRGRMFTDKRAVQQAAQAKWENDHNKAIAGYYFSDTPTLPNLAKGTYHWLMGNVFGGSENPEYYMMNVGDAPSNIVGPAGATKLPTTAKEFVEAIKHLKELRPLRTLIESPFKNVKIPGSSRLPILHKNAVTGTVTRNVGKSQHGVPKDIPENVRGTFNRGYETGFEEGRVQGLQSASNATVGYRQQIADLEAAKAKSDETIRQMTQQIDDLSSQVARTNTSAQATSPVQAATQAAPAQAAQAAQAIAPATNTSAADSGKGFWGNLQRVLWETKDNNFGKYYIGKNILRAAGYPFIIPPILGTLYEHVPEAFRSYGDYAKKSFNYGRGKPAVQDSIPVNNSQAVLQLTDSQQVQQPQPVFSQVKGDTIEKEDLKAIMDSLSRR